MPSTRRILKKRRELHRKKTVDRCEWEKQGRDKVETVSWYFPIRTVRNQSGDRVVGVGGRKSPPSRNKKIRLGEGHTQMRERTRGKKDREQRGGELKTERSS